MFTSNLKFTPVLVMLLTAATNGFAQQPENNDDRFRTQYQDNLKDIATEEALLSGDTDIVLLRKTKLFTPHGSASRLYTSNASLSPSNPVDDQLDQMDFGLLVSTRIDQRVTVFADISALSVRYAWNSGLNYSALTGVLGAKTNFGLIGAALSYRPTKIYDGDFGVWKLTQHRLIASVSMPLRWKQLLIEPSVDIERVLTTPSDYQNRSSSARLAVSLPLSKTLPVEAFASGEVERRKYDSYFPDLLGTDRLDKRMDASVGLRWHAASWANATLQYSRQRNKSTSDVNGYRATSGLLGLSAQLRF